MGPNPTTGVPEWHDLHNTLTAKNNNDTLKLTLQETGATCHPDCDSFYANVPLLYPPIGSLTYTSMDTMKLSRDFEDNGSQPGDPTTQDKGLIDQSEQMHTSHISVDTTIDDTRVTNIAHYAADWAVYIHNDGGHVWFRPRYSGNTDSNCNDGGNPPKLLEG